MKINILDLPVFYINLKGEKQKDKLTHQLLKEAGFTNINRFDAVLGVDKTEGCAKSHQKLLAEIDVDGPFIVVEDDIEITGSFSPILEIPENSDAVYLGISKFSLNNGKTYQDIVAEDVGAEIYRIYNMLAAHAILYITKDYYRFISKAIQSMIDVGKNQDNARAETMKYFNIYALGSPLFYQDGRHRDVTKFNMSGIPLSPYRKGLPKRGADRSEVPKTEYKLDKSFFSKKPPNISIVILSWQRPQGIKLVLEALSKQTYKNFSIHISNGNLSKHSKLKNYVDFYEKNHKMKIRLTHDGNDLFAFRRLTVAKSLAEAGTDIVLYLDDDISIPENYVEMCLSQYQPKTYMSGFAWSLFENGKDYYKHRVRQWDNSNKVQYCGTGISMIDAKIFLEDGLVNPDFVPHGAYRVEDLWLSYYADHVLGWKLAYIAMPGVVIGGGDSVALYRQVQRDIYDKADFLRDLVSMGWKIPKGLVKA
jgi:hypothetical protein